MTRPMQASLSDVDDDFAERLARLDQANRVRDVTQRERGGDHRAERARRQPAAQVLEIVRTDARQEGRHRLTEEPPADHAVDRPIERSNPASARSADDDVPATRVE